MQRNRSLVSSQVSQWIGVDPISRTAVALLPTVLGGSLTSDSTYYYRTFTSNGTFVLDGGNLPVDALIVGGGGAGGSFNGRVAGGGAGGYISTALILEPGSYSIVIGAGGSIGSTYVAGDNSSASSTNGSNTVATLSQVFTAIGGGRGGSGDGSATGTGANGGSGGGAWYVNNPGLGTASQGNNGGFAESNPNYGGGGGGGAGAVGGRGTTARGGAGGNGLQWLNGSHYAGGGSSDLYFATGTNPGVPGVGGGGTGTNTASNSQAAGSANTGGGGGANGAGGSGVVIFRYLKSEVDG